MAVSSLTIRLGLTGATQVAASLRQLTGQVTRGFSALQTAAVAATGALAAFAGITGIGAAVKRGIEFNAMIQESILGIAGVQQALNPDVFKTFDQAMVASTQTMEHLKEAAVKSPATLKELANTFKSLTGVATAAGIPLSKQVELLVVMSQAMPVLVQGQGQLLQESRALLSGNINNTAQAARTLQITKAQIDLARKEGRLFEFLMARFAPFKEAGERAATGWTTVLSNVTDVIDQMLGQSTVRITRFATDATKAFSDFLVSIDIGPKVDAWVGAFVDAWHRNQLADFIALTMEVAWDKAEVSLQASWARLFEHLGTDAWKHALLGFMRLGHSLTEIVVSAISFLVKPIGALATWMVDRYRWAFATAWEAFKVFGAEAINWAIDALDKLARKFMPILNAATFGAIPMAPIKVPRITVDPSVIKDAQTWEQAMANAGKARASLLDDIREDFAGIRDAAAQLLELDRSGLATDAARLERAEKLRTLLEGFMQPKVAMVALQDTKPKGDSFDLDAFELASKARLLALEKERAEVEGNFRITEADKFRTRFIGLTKEREAIEAIIRTLRARAAETEGEQVETIKARIDAYEKELSARNRSLATLGPDPSSWSDQWRSALTDLRNEFGTLQQSVARGFKSVIGGAVDSIAGGIKGLISYTMTWRDALQSIGTGILDTIIDAISRMFAEWIVGRLLASGVAKSASVSEGAVDATAKAPGALFSSISSWGVAAAVGLAALLAGIAMLSGAFALGGRPPVGQMALVGELGPELFVPDRPGTILPNGAFAEDADRPAAPDKAAPVNNSVNVAMFDSRLDARRWSETQEAETWFVDMARRNAHKFQRG